MEMPKDTAWVGENWGIIQGYKKESQKTRLYPILCQKRPKDMAMSIEKHAN